MTSITDPLPLRLTSAWPGYREAVPIPHRYGATAGNLIQYDNARQVFVWADHVCAGIDAIEIGGQAKGGWQFRNGQDSTGHPVCYVEFNQPVDEGVEVLARGRGKLHPRTGALITNAADVLWDVLANIGGVAIAESRLDRFRADARSLPVAGSITKADSLQTVAKALCASVGAFFCADTVAVAKVWPGGAQQAVRAAVTALTAAATTADAQLDDIINDLTIRFDWQADQARQSVRLEAPDSIRRYGRRARELDATWLVDARVAISVGTRSLQQTARAQWRVDAPGLRTPLAVGDSVDLQHPVVPVTGAQLVLSRELDLDAGATRITLAAPVGDVPRVDVVQRSQAFDPAQYSGVTIATQGDQRVITLTEENGSPIANAIVVLDGTITRQSDAAGRVSFPASQMPPGQHRLDVTTSDGRTLTVTVQV